MNFTILKPAILLCLHCLLMHPLQAQDKGKEELNVAGGLLATEDAISGAFALLFNLVLRTPEDLKIAGVAGSITYKYHVSERLAVGGSTVYNARAEETLPDFFTDSRWRRRAVSNAGEITLFWAKQPAFQFYSTFGAGFFVRRSTFYEAQAKTNFGYTMQASPVGIRVGNKVAGFMEMGFGYKGFLNAGLSMRF